MSKKYTVLGVASVVAVLLGLAVFVFQNLSDIEFKDARVSTLQFRAGGAELVGTLALPMNVQSAPVALIIHGDGPVDRFASDGYFPLINSLLDAGIGVFTWDKQGVGESSGNWLNQSMSDRATEAVAALARVRKESGVATNKVGFLGFSQGGWVIPRAASEGDPDFSVIIGGAVSWRRQGMYYTGLRLAAEGRTQDEINVIVREEYEKNDKIFGNPNEKYTSDTFPDMDRTHFNFVLKNYNEDVTPSLKTMKGPVLAIWGAMDLNVNAAEDSKVYKELFSGVRDRQVIVIPDATHGLLRAGLFNYQLVSQWPIWKEYLFVALGRRSYAPGTLHFISDWIRSSSSNDQS
ncbi:S9 family peptidase [Pseudomonas sp. B21-048]|uniref:alpha/beta hydrolase family protein n=1 Tax=Pseudomonas sp. B21-048 TaxID=2895490 RepID=UPI002160FE28|nr:alpha/beta fold hydrolase [Pseudomonas sp. B21-048]UVK96706.1 alpha/beta fold hydrolase [Pseudomonas sp. B21-048]